MIKADYFGKPGNVDRYYWVVAQFIIANPLTIGPAIVRTTNPLSNDDRVLLKWDYVPGAIYYTVVQTATATPPNLQTIAVAVIQSTTTITDATDYGVVQDWYYPNPATGGSGASGVASWKGRTGNVLPAIGDYDATMVTGAVRDTTLIIPGLGLTGGGPLSSNVTISQAPDTVLQKTYVYNSGTPIAQRSYLNLIGGSALTISATDNPGQNWIDVVFSSKTGSGSGLVDPTVSKGDLLVRNVSQVQRLPVGSDGQVLVADSTQPTGIKWGSGSSTIALATSQYGGFPGFIHDLGSVSRLVLAETPTIVWYTGQNGLDAAIYANVLPHETGVGYPDSIPSQQAQLTFQRADGEHNSASFFVPYNMCQLQIQAFAEDQLTTSRPVPQININAQGMLTERPNTIEIGYTDGTWTYDAIYCDLLNSRVGIGLRKFPGTPSLPAYALDVIGDCNITGVYRINGVPISTGGAAQTPWTSNIDAAHYDLNHAKIINFDAQRVTTDNSFSSAGTIQGITYTGVFDALRLESSSRPDSGGIEIYQNQNLAFVYFERPSWPDPTTIARTKMYFNMWDGKMSIYGTDSAMSLEVTSKINVLSGSTNPPGYFGDAGYYVNGLPLIPLRTKGDLLTANSSTQYVVLPVGTNGQVLTADSTTTTGLKWSTGSTGGGGGGGQTVPLIVNGTVVAQSTTEFFSDEAANAAADAIAAKLNGGTLRIYTDPRPTNVNTAITTQTLLLQVPFSNPAFSAASGGVATANSITSGTGLANGVATWFRTCKSDGTAVFDGSVGTALADLVLTSVNISTGASETITNFTITQDKMRT